MPSLETTLPKSLLTVMRRTLLPPHQSKYPESAQNTLRSIIYPTNVMIPKEKHSLHEDKPRALLLANVRAE
jgi:hypothetical protein